MTNDTLADEIAGLIEAAIKEADDLRYYSGGSKRNMSKEALAEKIILAGSIIDRALRTPPTSTDERKDVLEEAARIADVWAKTEPTGGQFAGFIAAGCREAGEKIAAAIRALTTKGH